jgi:hypothetical protein
MARAWFIRWVGVEEDLAERLNDIEESGAIVFQIFFIRYSERGKTGYRVICYNGDRPDKLSVEITNLPKPGNLPDVIKVEVTNPVDKVEVTNTIKAEVTNTGAILVDTSGKVKTK